MDDLPELRDLTDSNSYSVREIFEPASGWVLNGQISYRDFVVEGLRDNLGSYSSFDTT